jgi:hypothetical protein
MLALAQMQDFSLTFHAQSPRNADFTINAHDGFREELTLAALSGSPILRTVACAPRLASALKAPTACIAEKAR